MILYAAKDTHYLLHIAQLLVLEARGKGLFIERNLGEIREVQPKVV